MKQINIFLLSCIFSLLAYAQPPSGYYTAATGKSAATLKTALFGIIHSHTELSYGALWTAYQTTDKRPDGKVWDIYSDVPNGTPAYLYNFGTNQCGIYSREGDCYNREHSFPQSWFNKLAPMVSDIFHIYPTDGLVNGKRSNFPYGEVGIASFTSTNGSKLGQCTFPGYSGTVFEPRDDFKGDLARTYFYMATCYEDKIAAWATNTEAKPLLAGNSYPAFKEWTINLLLKWSRQDPVSQKEIDRNNAVYALQGNRNPYIDYPELAEYVWGNKKDQPFQLNMPTVSVTPSDAVDFGKNIPETTSRKTITLRAYNITGGITLRISGTGASKFSVSPTALSLSEALAGKELNLSYNSNTASLDSATLTIDGGGAPSVVIALKGKSSNDFMALPASEIMSSSFRANWLKSDGATGYILDVYQVQGTDSVRVPVFNYSFSTGLPSGITTSGYAKFEPTESALRLASAGSNGAVTTPAIGTSKETVLTVNARQHASDNSALSVSVGGVNIGKIVTSATAQNYTMTIPANNSASQITLSANSKARVYLSSLSLEEQGQVAVNTSLSGFPLTLGDVQSYVVTGLSESTKYYYTLTPIGGSDSKTQAIQVKTNTLLSIGDNIGQRIHFYKHTGGFVVDGVTEQKTVSIYDLSGRLLKQWAVSATSSFVPFTQKGTYIISVGSEKFKLLF